jgi:glycine/D-amino acid oxidase-like deaminating enzyme
MVDQHPPGHGRAASGTPSRILCCGYATDAPTVEAIARARELWKEIEVDLGAELFIDSGYVKFIPATHIPHEEERLGMLEDVGVRVQRLQMPVAERMFPSVNLSDCAWVVYEPDSGALRARRAVEALVAGVCRRGGNLVRGRAQPAGDGAVTVDGHGTCHADLVIYACGGWTKELFPKLLAGRTVRHDLFFFGAPRSWSTPTVPAWTEAEHEFDGVGDLDGQGVRLGGRFDDLTADLDDGPWAASEGQEAAARRILGHRFPALADAPLIAGAACHSTEIESVHCEPVAVVGGARVMRVPGWERVWIVGDGSGSLFKHSPSIAREVEGLVAQ